MKPELISFKLCPFVQRLVIVLREKEADFDVTYIELDNPPAWFRELSPMGKVPMLRVGDTVLFESAVIMEYLDEVNPPPLHPADPLQKARNRAWIEFGSSLLFTQHRLLTTKDESEFQKTLQELKAGLLRVEGELAGPFFNGGSFSLADAAYAPLLMRLDLLERQCSLGLFDALKRIAEWKEELLQRRAVRQSVVEEFAQLYVGMIGRNAGVLARWLDGG